MSAFLAYSGSYDFGDFAFDWRCYATTRIHAIRRRDHAPLPPAPAGRKWVAPTRRDSEHDVLCLVDAGVEDFFQMLLQVQSQRVARIPAAEAPVASVAA